MNDNKNKNTNDNNDERVYLIDDFAEDIEVPRFESMGGAEGLIDIIEPLLGYETSGIPHKFVSQPFN